MTNHVDSQGFESTEFGPHESGVPETASESSEAPKLGGESTSNFGAGPGVPPNRRTIH